MFQHLQGTAEEEVLKVRHEQQQQQQSDVAQPNLPHDRADGMPSQPGPGRQRRLTDREGHEALKRAARNRVLSTLRRVHVLNTVSVGS